MCYSIFLNMEGVDTRSTAIRKILDMRLIGFEHVLTIGRYNYTSVQEGLEAHIHPGMIEICYLERGTQVYQVEGTEYLLKGGDVLVTQPDRRHGTSGYPEEKGQLYWMLLKIPGEGKGLLNLADMESDYLIHQLKSFHTPHFRGMRTMVNDLKGIFKAYNNTADPVHRKIEITNLVLSFLLKVIKAGENEQQDCVSYLMKGICDHIHENIYEELVLDELASRANLSLSRFKHRFKEELGIPPGEYIMRLKIEKAKELLKKGLKTRDVAYTLGFETSNYFATVFRKFVGQTPTYYSEH